MKTCSKCFKSKEFSEFYFRKDRGRYRNECKICWTLQRQPSLYDAEYYKQYRKDRPEINKTAVKRYRTKNPHVNTEASSRHRAVLRNACPKWLTKEHKRELNNIFKNRPIGFHVDHIIPLRGKEVSGLHVPWNLQHLPAIENLKKQNKVS